MRQQLLLGAWLWVACAGAGEPLAPCPELPAVDGGAPRGSGAPLQTLHPVGKPLSLALTVPLTPRCAGQQLAAQQVRTEVFDGEGNSVEHTAGAPRTEAGVASTVVSFVPQTLGSHYLKARFEPDLGVAQGVVEVVGAASAVLLDTLPVEACASVALLPSRAVLCFTAAEVVVRREGVEVQRLPLTVRAWVAAGRALWLDDGVARRRLLDLGTGPLLEGAARGQLQPAGATVFATETSLFSLHPSRRNRVLRQALVADALVETLFTLPPQPGSPLSLPALGLALDDERLAVSTFNGFVCQLRLPSEGSLTAQVLRCDAQPSPQPVIAEGGERFWLQQTDGALVAAHPQPDGLRVERFVAQGLWQLASAEGRGLPALRSADLRQLLVPRLRPAVHPVVLEFPQALGDGVVVGEGTVVARSADGTHHLVFRW